MAIFRVHKTKNYTVMANHHLQNKALSLRARGLMSVILSLPDDWNYSKAGLLRIVNESEFILNSTLDELKEHGYLQIEKHKPISGSNRYTYTYNVYEVPRQDPNFQGIENQDLENQDLENQGVENWGLNKRRNLSNTERHNTNKRNTKTHNGVSERIAEYTDNEELRETLTAFIQYRKDIRKPMNENTVKLMLNKLNKLGQTDAERIEVLNQSMVNGWQGIFELKREVKSQAEVNADKREALLRSVVTTI